MEQTLCPHRYPVISATPHIHMRNAYMLNHIAKKYDDVIVLENPRNDRVANLDDVIGLMLLEAREQDELQIALYSDPEDEGFLCRAKSIVEDIAQALSIRF